MNLNMMHKISTFFSFRFLFLSVVSFFSSFSIVMADKPVDWQMWYQDAASPVMERINSMHINLMYLITAILAVVTIALVVAMVRFREKKNPTASKTTHNVPLEILWTLVPAIIVAVIAFPSIKLIFYMDKAENPDMTVKVIGHQWYWEYDYPDHGVSFDSFMLNKDQLKDGQIRNLEVDRRVIVPVNKDVRILATSADVLHSWAVPAFGVKQDTIPGRVRETWVRVTKPGVYYGQCSELCGSGHGFMSIAVEAVSEAEFAAWIQKEGGKMPEVKEAVVDAIKEGDVSPAKSATIPTDEMNTPKDDAVQRDSVGENAVVDPMLPAQN